MSRKLSVLMVLTFSGEKQTMRQIYDTICVPRKSETRELCVYVLGLRQVTFEQRSDYKAEKTMVPHSSTLAWRIPWTEEPGRLQSMGLHRV